MAADKKARRGDRHLLTRLRGAVIVVWDGGPVHRGEAIRAVLRDDPRLSLEKLPPDTPELNPVEYLWNHLKYGVLSHSVPDDVFHLDGVVKQRLRRARLSPQRLRSFFKHSGLPIRLDSSQARFTFDERGRVRLS